jgi:hypothetical protein
MLDVVKLNVVMPDAVMVDAVMLDAVMLDAFMLNAIMLNVDVPLRELLKIPVNFLSRKNNCPVSLGATTFNITTLSMTPFTITIN